MGALIIAVLAGVGVVAGGVTAGDARVNGRPVIGAGRTPSQQIPSERAPNQAGIEAGAHQAGAGQNQSGQAGAGSATPTGGRQPAVLQGDPAMQELGFLLTLQQRGVDYGSPAQAVAAGHLACAAFADGDRWADVVAVTRSYGHAGGGAAAYSANEAAFLVGAAVPVFCPQFASRQPPS